MHWLASVSVTLAKVDEALSRVVAGADPENRLDDNSVVSVHQLANSNTSGLMVIKQFVLSGSAELKKTSHH